MAFPLSTEAEKPDEQLTYSVPVKFLVSGAVIGWLTAMVLHILGVIH